MKNAKQEPQSQIESNGHSTSEFQQPVIFSALLTPHRSLGPKGFKILMAVFAAICIIAGSMFVTIGAWPVFGFFGLDILILYVAFRINYRAGRAYEEVSISREELLFRKVDPKGREREYRFNPFWTRFNVFRHKEIGITRMELLSRDAGDKAKAEIGSFLNPQDRETFASAFGDALVQARR